jgi:segregation and condensation protein A
MSAPAPDSSETPPASGSAHVVANSDYRVRLESFDGPLDLLLYLIRRAEVDIHDVPIAEITDQYVAYLSNVERIDIELAGEFLVMAATLMEIKARLLGNACQTDSSTQVRDARATDDDQGDPRADLIKQLLDYKAYRDAATGLEHQLEQWSQRFPAAKAKAVASSTESDAPPIDYDLDDLNIIDLVQAFADICSSVNFDRLGEHEVAYDDTPIELHAADIVDRLRRGEGADDEGHIPLVAIFRDRSRSEMIGLFMAMLELCRQHRIRVRQRNGVGEITVCLGDECEPSGEVAVQDASDDQGETIEHAQQVTAIEPSPAADGS